MLRGMTAHGSGRPRYLIIAPSTCQMSSGTGRAIFDWILFARNHFDFVILTDSLVEKSVSHTLAFCRRENIEVIVGSPIQMPGCIDVGIKEIPYLLSSHHFPFIECISWANAACNTHVLSAIQPNAVLIYTPHTQPLWTVVGGAELVCIEPTFHRMLSRADAVFADSNAERALPLFSGRVQNNIFTVPLGVDPAVFHPKGVKNPKMLLSVCDFRERRKRSDLLMDNFLLAHARDPALSLTLVGNGSENYPIPNSLERVVTAKGFISEAELIDLYRSAGLYILLSDYEAFGLPIAEALCCGTPVLINNQDVMVELFGDLPGVNVVDNSAQDTLISALNRICDTMSDPGVISRAATERFSLSNTYGRKLSIVSSLSRDTAYVLQ